MSTALNQPIEVTKASPASMMEIRGWWAIGSLLFYPLFLFWMLLPLWPDLFRGSVSALDLDPFRTFLALTIICRSALVLIVATGIARAIVAAVGIHARHQRVKEYFRTTQIPSSILKDRLTALQAYNLPFVVYGDPVPRAFVLGILRTRIYISTGLLDSLSDLELGSVIMHEVHHHRNHDPLKGFLLSIFSHLFYYLPLVRNYAEFWQQHREWEADAAAKRVSDATSLAQALCKLLTISPHISSYAGFAVSATPTAAPAPSLHGMGNVRERIELLLDLRATRPWRMRGREYLQSALSLVLLAVLCLGLYPPVQMAVAANPAGEALTIHDASGWVLPTRVDSFWVAPFQGPARRVRFVGINPATAPPDSRHRLLP